MPKDKKATEPNQNQEREARSPVARASPQHLPVLGEESQEFDAKVFIEQILPKLGEEEKEVAIRMIKSDDEHKKISEFLKNIHKLSNQESLNQDLILNFQKFLNDHTVPRQAKQGRAQERDIKEERRDDEFFESGDTKQVQEVNFRAYDIFELSDSDISTQLQFIQQELNREDLSTLDKQRLIFEYELITSSRPELFKVPE